MTSALRFRRLLDRPVPTPRWPAGIELRPLTGSDPAALHALLVESYRTGFGTVPDLDDWWTGLTEDREFDAELVFVAVDGDEHPVGFAQCWSSGFLKDLVVAEHWRGKGLGMALLLSVFAACAERNLPAVDLKVVASNAPAQRLYRRLGMTEAPL